MKTTYRLSLIATLVAGVMACEPKQEAPQVQSEPVAAEAAAPQTAEPVAAEATAPQAVAGELTTDAQKQAYSLGASVGFFIQGRLQEQVELGIEIDRELILAGFEDGLKDQLKLSEEEVQAALQALDGQVRDKAVARAEAEAAVSLEAGKKYLADNGQREGVTTTDSGLQFEVVKAGDGNKPVASDTVTVHYRGTLIDGTTFDSSYDRGEPATFPLDRVIPGWTEGVQLMSVGSTYKFYIPSELGYGEQPVGSIPANSTLVFEVELLSIDGQDGADAAAEAGAQEAAASAEVAVEAEVEQASE